MKKLVLAVCAVICSVSLASAQDLETVAAVYNKAAETIESNKAEAITLFEQVLEQAAALGEDGSDLVSKCKDILPKLYVSLGKELASAKDMNAAVEKLQKAVSLAAEYGDADSEGEAKTLIPQLLMSEAGSLLNAKDFAAAAAAYQEVINVDPDNATAFLRMGQALASAGDADGAVEAFEQASSLGQKEAAAKQLGNLYLKKAAASQKAKDMKSALEFAQKSAEYADTPNAQKLIGTTALQLKQNKVAADAFEAYLALSPDAKDKVQIIFQLGTALMNAGDNSKACGYFKQVAQDAQFGEGARYYLTQLKCE